MRQVETLDYHDLSAPEKRFLGSSSTRPMCSQCHDRLLARRFDGAKSDARHVAMPLMTGTALSHGLLLATHNINDGARLEELDVVDPLSNKP